MCERERDRERKGGREYEVFFAVSTVCTKYFLRVMLLRQGSGAGDQVTLNYAVIIIILIIVGNMVA